MLRTRVLKALVLLALANNVYAEEPNDESPSLELLEYLATMVADEEGWVGPGDIKQFVMPDQVIIQSADDVEEGGDED